MEFQQYYPTYNYENRDVVLKEFENSLAIANGQERLYSQLASVFLAALSFGGSSLFGMLNKKDAFYQYPMAYMIIIYAFILFISLSILTYFIELQKSIVINSRKVVTLRRILGLDYGTLQLTLPNWRIEGATNPFIIKLFPGWIKFRTVPLYVVLFFLNFIWFLTYDYFLAGYGLQNYWYVINILVSISIALYYRWKLLELHESISLLCIKFFAEVLSVKLERNFEYVIYRLKLSAFENTRLRIELPKLRTLLINIEDKDFYDHNGVDLCAICRAILSRCQCCRKHFGLLQSGASTITMQLCRTLFISDYSLKFRRKIIEILLALWFEKQFKKQEILDFYLASVRFDANVNGVAKAIKHFFPNKADYTVSYEEAFFLIERLSNITSTYNSYRVNSLYQRLSNKDKIDFNELIGIYKYMVFLGKLKKKI